MQGTQQTWQQQLDSAANTAQTGMTGSFADFLKAELSGGQAQATDAAYKANGVDTAKQNLTAANTAMTTEQQALNNAIQNLKANPAGYTTAGLQDETNRLTSESLQKQANIAVTQLAASGLYTNAKDIADRAIAAQMEQRTNQIKVMDDIYQANKDIFTTAEQQKFQAAQAERNNQLQLDTHKEEAKYDEMIKQSDPLYKAQVAEAWHSANAPYANSNNGAPTLNGKPQTAAQAQVQGYADRTMQANAIIAENGAAGTNPIAHVLGKIPGVGNYLTGTSYQNLQQAQTNFVNAVLRRESGAAISSSEFDNAAKQYFPQPGDDATTIAQKAANRQTVIKNLYQQANLPAPEGTIGSVGVDPLGILGSQKSAASTNPLGI